MAKQIEEYVRKQISILARDGRTLDQSDSKARLAQLRRGIGKIPGELPELWGAFLKDLPEELMGKNEEPSYAEWAIYTVMTLFALHQQGNSEPMHAEGEENRFGKAVRRLIHGEEDEEKIRMKLSITAASEDMAELSYHLKTLVKLLGNNGIKLDYVNLAKDLYQFQFDQYTDRIRLKWGQDFYRSIKTDENGEKKNEE